MTDIVAPLKECKAYFSPVQEGSGDASPENVRNISGWNGFKIIRCGENLFNLNESDMVIDGWNRFFPNPMKVPGTYTISCEQQFGGNGTKGSAIFFVNYADNSAEHIGRGAIGYSFGSTVFSGNTTVTEEQANASYILFGMSSNNCTFESLENAKIQIQLGSTATEYESYIGTTIPITFPTEAETIYGGYIDLVNSTITITWSTIDLGTLDYTYRSTLGGGCFSTYGSQVANVALKPKEYFNGICSHYQFVGRYQNLNNLEHGVSWIYEDGIAVKDKSITFDDPEMIKAGFSGVVLAYEIETPITYAITSQTLKTLKGINNIWSNANGEIQVKYYAH